MHSVICPNHIFPDFLVLFSKNTAFEEQAIDQTTAFLHLEYSANNVV